MYPLLLNFHNINRWIVLILGLTAAYRSYTGLSGQKEWNALDRRWNLFFTISMDIQFVTGLVLFFFLSPITRSAMTQMSLILPDREQRFFPLIHPLYMLLAMLFTHLGSMLPRKAKTSLVKYQRSAAFFTLAILCILLGMPWTRAFFPGL